MALGDPVDLRVQATTSFDVSDAEQVDGYTAVDLLGVSTNLLSFA